VTVVPTLVSRALGGGLLSVTPARLVSARPEWISLCSSSSNDMTFSPGQAVLLVSSYLAPAQLLEEGAEHVPLWEA